MHVKHTYACVSHGCMPVCVLGICMCVLLCVCTYVSMNVRHVRIWVSISVRYVLV